MQITLTYFLLKLNLMLQPFKVPLIRYIISSIVRESFTSHKQKITTTVTESDINKFAQISGDSNPLHTNKQFASKSIFKQRISHGMYPMGFIEDHFQQQNMKIKKMEIKFMKPIYLEEDIIIDITVSDQAENSQDGNIKFVAEIKKIQKENKQNFNSQGSLISVTLITGEVQKCSQ